MEAIKVETPLVDLLGHLLDGGQVVVCPLEGVKNDTAPVAMTLKGTVTLVTVNTKNEVEYNLLDTATMFKAYYTPEQEEIRRLKVALENSQREIARLTQPKPRANYTRLEIGIFTEIKDYRAANPRASISDIVKVFDCSYGFVQRILSGQHNDLEAAYATAKKAE